MAGLLGGQHRYVHVLECGRVIAELERPRRAHSHARRQSGRIDHQLTLASRQAAQQEGTRLIAAARSLTETHQRASDDEKTLYIVGIALGRSTTTLNVTPAELELIKLGMADQIAGRPSQVSVETYGPKVEQFAKRRAAESVDKTEAAGKAFIEAAAKEPGAVKSESGLVFRTLKPGSGRSPTYTDRVKVHYRAAFTDGTVFDSEAEGTPVDLVLAGTIPCWIEALQKVKIGETARLVCPPSLAYGDQGRPPTLPGHATLVFEIDLVSAEPAMDAGAPPPNIPPGIRAP
jgi:FKBP-type peptidyl-prolyl cis-trans isomerase FkpA